MKTYAPAYYHNFKCIGGECTDNCCIGWEIDIDDETLELYEKMDGEIGERIRKSIKYGPYTHFKLCAGERCPHLNKDNLCDIIIECGEDAICEICREHPRYYAYEGDILDVGIGLSCPTAAELILANNDFTLKEIDELDGCVEDYDEATFLVIKAFRERILKLLPSVPLSLLIPFIARHARDTVANTVSMLYAGTVSVIDIGEETFPSVLEDAFNEVTGEDVSKYALIYSKLELLNEEFGEEMAKAFELLSYDGEKYVCDADFGAYLTAHEMDYRRLLFYFVHRYLLGATTDCEEDVRMRHALVSPYLILAIGYLRGARGEDILSAAVDYSKNVEYSDLNYSILRMMSCFEGYVSPLFLGQIFP